MTEIVRPNFSCTVCHQSFASVHPFQEHLESPEHELSYGLRLKNSLVGSYFCNCCHVCVNTLLIWKSHILGMKHMKIASAFTAAYPSFDFDKPARVADVGILDQNVELPESLQRPAGKPSLIVRAMEKDSIVIGVTEIIYDGPGLYTCRICDEPFNEGNKSQHLLSCRHRVNVFKRWDSALADEALMVKEVGKPEFSARCETIASEIFPVEQGILNKNQKMLYERIMGTNSVIDEQFNTPKLPEPVVPARPAPPYNAPVRPPPPPVTRGHPNYPDPYGRERPYPPVPREDPYDRPRPRYPPPAPLHPRDHIRGHPRDHPRDPYPRDHRYDDPGYGRGPPPNRPQEPYPPIPRNPRSRGDYYPDLGRGGPSNRLPRKDVLIDSPLKCDLAMETIRTLLKNLNVFASEAPALAIESVTRVEVLKSQILFDEILKMSYPKQETAVADDEYITVFHNGRLTLKRREPVPKASIKEKTPEVQDHTDRQSRHSDKNDDDDHDKRDDDHRDHGKDDDRRDRKDDDRRDKNDSDRRDRKDDDRRDKNDSDRRDRKDDDRRDKNDSDRRDRKDDDRRDKNDSDRRDRKDSDRRDRKDDDRRDRRDDDHGRSRRDDDRRDRRDDDHGRSRERKFSHDDNKDMMLPPKPLFPIPPRFPPPGMGPPTRPMLDPWGRPIMIPGMQMPPGMTPMGGDMQRMPFFPPPGFRPEGDRDRSPRKRTPPPSNRDSKRNRSNSPKPKKSPERVVTIKTKLSPTRKRSPSGRRKPSPGRKSPSRRTNRSSPTRKRSSERSGTGRRSPGRKSPGRTSPGRKSPGRKSPTKRSPSRRSPVKQGPGRRSPSRRSPRRKSPARSRDRRPRSPDRNRKSPPKRGKGSKEEDGTVFLEDDAYAELLASLG